MKTALKTVLWLAVALALFGWYYLHDVKGGLKKGGASKEKRLFALEKDAVDFLAIRDAGRSVEAVKEGGSWRITVPAAADADADEVSRIVGDLLDAEIESLGPCTDPAQYGLAAGREIVLGTPAGKFPVRVGDENPAGGSLYCTKDGTTLLLVPSWRIRDVLSKDAAALRDKRVLPFEKAGLKDVTLTTGKLAVVLERRGSKWFLATPTSDEADASRVDEILDALRNARVKSFEEPGASQARFGFGKPSLVVSLRNADGMVSTLTVGAKKTDTTYYAKSSLRPDVVEIEQDLVTRIPASAADFRNTALFSMENESAAAVSIAGPSGTVALSRIKDGWTVGGRPAAKEKVESYLSDLRFLRASSFAAPTDALLKKHGLAPGVLTVRVSSAGGIREEAVFGLKTEKELYAYLPARNVIATLYPEEFARLDKKAGDFAPDPQPKTPARKRFPWQKK